MFFKSIETKLREENVSLKITNQMLENELTDLKNKIKNANREAEYIFDFESMKPFSIERLNNKTVFGYFHENQIRTWNFDCSIENHNYLANQFQNFLNKTNK